MLLLQRSSPKFFLTFNSHIIERRTNEGERERERVKEKNEDKDSCGVYMYVCVLVKISVREWGKRNIMSKL